MKLQCEIDSSDKDMMDHELLSSPSTRELLSRVASRCASPTSPGGGRLSVRDQLVSIDNKCQAHDETIEQLRASHDADKLFLLSKINELAERMEDEVHTLRVEYQKKLQNANEEIERLNKCLQVQRGHITTLQEQCQSLHRHVVQVDEDVNKLAAEVLGDS